MNIKLQAIMILTALTLLISIVQAQKCAKGCLLCGQDNNCKICDTANFFILQTGECIPVLGLTNCLSIDVSGKCVQCNSGYYVDPATFKCVTVDQTSIIQNCAIYSSRKSCIGCKLGYYVKNSICLGTGVSLSNCELQLDDKICLSCKPGFVLMADSSGCIEVPLGIPNCANFAFVRCNGCSANFLLDHNKYLRDFATAITTNTHIDQGIAAINNAKKKEVNQGFRSVCNPVTVMNCAEVLSATKCRRCLEGYFLTDTFTCQINPSPSIYKCRVYSSATTCIECEKEFFVNQNAGCTAVTPINGCTEYDTTATRTICIRCSDTYFLASSLNCTLRSRTNISNCIAYVVDRDACETCDSGYIVTSDGSKCLPQVPNCAEYNLSGNSTVEHSCKRCGPGFYMITDKECHDGLVDNCEIFVQDTGQCSICDERYYIESATICSEHNTIPGCSEYHNTTKNRCQKCENANLLFQIQNRCAPASEIPGCLIYSTETTCEKCGTGFYTSGTLCTPIPSNLNCLEAESLAKCTKCKSNYVLFNDQCKIIPNFVINQCEVHNILDGLQTIQSADCFSCNNSTIAWDFKNEYVCLESDWLSVLQSTAIQNCVQFYIDGATTTCIRCAPNFYLNNNACVSSCTDNRIVTSGLIAVNTKFKISTGEFCGSDSMTGKVTNCEIYAYASNNVSGDLNATPICVHCADNYGKVIDPTSHISTGIEDALNRSDIRMQFLSPVTFLPKVTSCINQQSGSTVTISLATSGNKYIQGCEYYKLSTTANTYGCIKCRNGHSGLLENTTVGVFIKQCDTITCSSSFIPGLQPQLNSYVSCFQCADNALIPFLFIKGGTTYSTIDGYKSYDLTRVDRNWDNVATGGYNINCYKKDGTGFPFITPYNLPTNCALGAFNVESTSVSADNANKTSLTSNTNLTVFCLACQPGYRRLFGKTSTDVAIPYFVYACEPIQNCSTVAWLNYCSECSPNYAFLYNSTSGVDFTQCVSFSKDVHCLATTAALTGQCAICKKGYIPNYDGVCEALKVPNCEDNKHQLNILFSRFDFNTIFYHVPLGAGCYMCKSGYLPFSGSLVNKMCVTSSYVSTIDTMETTNYIRNCTNYYLMGSQLMCRKCRTGFVLAANLIQCLPSAQLNNCALALTNTECQTCDPGYVSVLNKCQKTTIANCVTYEIDPSQTKQKCIECEPEFFINVDVCQKGMIQNCAYYKSNGDGCNQCKSGYQLVRANGRDICFELPTDMNCDIFNAGDFNQNILNCTMCNVNTPSYISPTTENESSFTCLPINGINGCETYANEGYFSGSTLLCTKCGEKFFLSNGQCLLRTKLGNNCDKYDPKTDNCETCIYNHFIDNGLCVRNPVGVMNCRTYVTESICFSCKADAYLNNNVCIAILQNARISNCVYYKNESTCSECKSGYALVAGTCVQTSARNCLRVKSATECESCEPKRGLRTENGVTSCVNNTDPNCLTFIQVFPFKCTLCKSGFYPDTDGMCTTTTLNINNCEIYDTATSCQKCTKGFALGTDRTKCTNSSDIRVYIGSTCESSIIESNPVCLQCEGGYTFDAAGNCKKTCNEGCYFCDPDNPTICLLCGSGSYMDSKLKCVNISGNDVSGSNDIPFFKATAVILLLMNLLY